MSYLFKKIILNKFQYSLEHKYIINSIEINKLWDEIDNCMEYEEEDILLDVLNKYEEINLKIKKILSTINI